MAPVARKIWHSNIVYSTITSKSNYTTNSTGCDLELVHAWDDVPNCLRFHNQEIKPQEMYPTIPSTPTKRTTNCMLVRMKLPTFPRRPRTSFCVARGLTARVENIRKSSKSLDYGLEEQDSFIDVSFLSRTGRTCLSTRCTHAALVKLVGGQREINTSIYSASL